MECIEFEISSSSSYTRSSHRFKYQILVIAYSMIMLYHTQHTFVCVVGVGVGVVCVECLLWLYGVVGTGVPLLTPTATKFERHRPNQIQPHRDTGEEEKSTLTHFMHTIDKRLVNQTSMIIHSVHGHIYMVVGRRNKSKINLHPASHAILRH